MHEKNYRTPDLELEVVVIALKIWRHYFGGVHIYVYTDQKSFKYIFTQKEFNIRQKRWLELLKDYDMSVLYQPGRENVFEDAVSRITIDCVSHVEKS